MNTEAKNACKTCGATENVFESDFYHEAESHPINGDTCTKCEVAKIVEERERRDALEYAELDLRNALAHGGVTREEFTQRHLKPLCGLSYANAVHELWKRVITETNAYTTGHTYPHQNSYRTLATDEPKLVVGSVIWRTVSWNVYKGARLEPQSFTKNKYGHFVAFARWQGWPCYEASSKGPGLVCLSSKEIPADWRAFKITGWSRNGKSAFVEPMAATREQLLDAYSKTCKCGQRRTPLTTNCEGCRAQELAKLRKEYAESQQPKLGYVPSPEIKNKPFVCRSCSPAAPKGRGRCAICKQEYV